MLTRIAFAHLFFFHQIATPEYAQYIINKYEPTGSSVRDSSFFSFKNLELLPGDPEMIQDPKRNYSASSETFSIYRDSTDRISCLVDTPYMRKEGFIAYMLSDECQAVNPYQHRVNQDMDQPLSHYFISSSHNTFLLADQLKVRTPSNLP
jgi:hypothetical protein